MKIIQSLFSSLLFICIFLYGYAFASENVEAISFVNEASVRGIAQIEAARLALDKSTSAEVKTYAQQVIDDRTAANKELVAIAQKNNLKMVSNSELTSRSKEFAVKQRDDQSFDEAYARNQVKVLRDTIEIFNKTAVSKDIDLAGFATENIPKLKHHLSFAEQLSNTFDKK